MVYESNEKEGLYFIARAYFKALSNSAWTLHPERRTIDLHVFDLLFGGLSPREQAQIVSNMRDRIKNII